MDNDHFADTILALEGLTPVEAIKALAMTLADLASSIDAIELVAKAPADEKKSYQTPGERLATIYLMTQFAKQPGDKRPEIGLDELVAKTGVSREDAQLALDHMNRTFDRVERAERDDAVTAVEGLLNL